MCKYFLYVFEKICCFCISHHHSIVTAGVSQLVTMDGLHVSFSGCFYRVKSGFWSHFCLSVFLTVFHVDHKKSSSSYSSFSPLKMSLSSLSLSLLAIHHFLKSNTNVSFLNSFLQSIIVLQIETLMSNLFDYPLFGHNNKQNYCQQKADK